MLDLGFVKKLLLREHARECVGRFRDCVKTHRVLKRYEDNMLRIRTEVKDTK